MYRLILLLVFLNSLMTYIHTHTHTHTQVSEIQNAGLGEHRLRDLNDQINKALRCVCVCVCVCVCM